MDCRKCGRESSRQCPLCDENFCYFHWLPEFHNCSNVDPIDELKEIEEETDETYAESSKEIKDIGGQINSGRSFFGVGSKQETEPFSDTEKTQNVIETEKKTKPQRDTRGGLDFSKTGNKITFSLVGLMVLVYIVQVAVIFSLGPVWHDVLFVLHPNRILLVWTWVTSIFAHSTVSFFHLLINGSVLLFFGTLIERKVGGKEFLSFFLFTGIISGLSQTLMSSLVVPDPNGVLGASGAVMGVLGALTVLEPKRKIYIVIIPMPLWLATFLFASYDTIVLGLGGIGFGGVARLAHISGLTIGLLYGWNLRNIQNKK